MKKMALMVGMVMGGTITYMMLNEDTLNYTKRKVKKLFNKASNLM